VIVVLQVPDFTGMNIEQLQENFLGKLGAIAGHLADVELGSFLVARQLRMY
jgi:hypothetical protein